MSEEEEKSVKVVLLGEAGVGKTCIISRFVNNMYEDKTMSNISAAYATKTMKFDAFGGKEIKYELWDTAGQEKFRAVTRFLYKDAQVVILVYDITVKESFNEIKDYWYNQVKENCPTNTIICLAGNKCDLFEREAVTEEEGKELAKEMGALFQLTSPKEKIGIDELFQTIGYKILPNLFPNIIGNKGESLLYHTMMGDEDGFEIIDKKNLKNIKLDEFAVKKIKGKKSC